MKKHIVFLLVLFSAMWVGSSVDAAIIVGRISYLEGQIYRYMDVDDSWVATSLQSPAGTQDILATGDESKAEITFPNNQLVRLDESSEIEILNLDDDIGEFFLHSGIARFYNRSSTGKLLIKTVRGTATIEPGSVIDVLADKQSITVNAVHGEANFHSYQNGVENIETISGSTSLEFQEKSIIAGIGPIDSKWDRWCVAREGALTQNRMVRSEHLPESMQEYAYVMEPYGRWQRIYYRGYYYWAWKPHSVAVGWSPYTTGYWFDWHGSSVWIDYNPWGWATHHHGHWLHMQGAWLWTPYVHVSHVPGVTVIGFNISFGKRYRPHWHPGRVRWIAHNDHIGWLPLAPWEIHYGYRKWAPRTVVRQGGAGFSVNLNLSSHRHIDHAVIIPKRHMYQRKPGVINNYNKVRVKSINRNAIVKNFKSLPVVERKRGRKHSNKVIRAGNGERRIQTQHLRKTIKTREIIRNDTRKGKSARSILTQRNMLKERSVTGTYEKGSSRNIKKKHSVVSENNGNHIRKKALRERVATSDQRNRVRTVEKREREIVKKSVEVIDKSHKRSAKRVKNQNKGNEIKQAQVRISRKIITKRGSNTDVSKKNGPDDRKRMKRESRVSQRQVERNLHKDKDYKESNRKNKKFEEGNHERQTARNTHYGKERSASRGKGEYSLRSGRDRYSASLNSRRIR